MHRCSDAIAVTEVNVVPHPDFIPVVENRRARKREKQAVQKFNAAAIIVHQRRQTPPDAEIDAHPGIGAVGQVHIVAFVFRDLLERQLVMVPQEQSPLACCRNLRGLRHDVGDRQPVFLTERHVDARHQGKVEGHVALVALAKIWTDVGGPLIRFHQDHPVRVTRVNFRAQFFHDGMSFRKVLAVGSLPLDQVRDRVHAQRVHTHVEPVAHDIEHLCDHPRVAIVQIRLVRKESVPEIGLRHRIPSPVRFFGVGKNDPGVVVFLIGVTPHIEIALRRPGWCLACALKPGVLIGCMIHNQLDHHLKASLVRRGQKLLEVLDGSVTGVDTQVVRDIVAVILERRRKEREKPEAGDAQVLKVIELLDQTLKVSDSVAIAVKKSPNVKLVDDGIFIPKRIAGATRLLHRHSPHWSWEFGIFLQRRPNGMPMRSLAVERA